MGDARLDALEQQIAKDSPRLAAAVARYSEARALAYRARADLFPELDAKGAASRVRVVSPSTGPPIQYNDFALKASISYELDL